MPEDASKRFLNTYPKIIDELKAKAKAAGLWNLFLSAGHYKEGSALTNLEYGICAEIMGTSYIASEAMNCSAPDTGNMEVLAKYGNEAQKRVWLKPLLDGQIRSAFVMTERMKASSDARNIDLDMVEDGDSYILNGTVGCFPWVPEASQMNPKLACRNGGAVVLVTHDANYTWLWARPTQRTPIPTSNRV